MPDTPPQRLRLSERFAALPSPVLDVGPNVRAAVAAAGQSVVVLDDDPTGTQTVHDVPVLTGWGIDTLAAELRGGEPVFYVLTNSRSLPPAEADALARTIGQNLHAAGAQSGRPFVVVSRGDSTLRGHFPGEVDALADGLGIVFDACLLIPFFAAGGRYTIDDVHYVAQDDWLVPAGQTEWARDAAFGYRSSNLRTWVEEKTGGRVPAGSVASVSLDEIRRGGPDAVAARLMGLTKNRVCVVNAADAGDLDVFVLGLLAAEARGKRFLSRTAASFVPVRAGLSPQPLLAPVQIVPPDARGGALIVVGSYVPKTTTQLAALLQAGQVEPVEVRVETLLGGSRSDEIAQAIRRVDEGLKRGADVVLFTSRALVAGADAAESLALGARVSAALVEIVRALLVRPRFLLAKGGITSSDLATGALHVSRALVRGQALPGVPVWEMGPESRWPGLPFLVFPGNVGDENALADLVAALRRGN